MGCFVLHTHVAHAKGWTRVPTTWLIRLPDHASRTLACAATGFADTEICLVVFAAQIRCSREAIMSSALQQDAAVGPTPQTTASPARKARMAGVLYLVVAVLGAFAQVIRVQTYVPGDATATAANVVAKIDLLRLSFVADLTQNLVWLFFAMALYRLLQHSGKNLARATVIFVIVSVAVAMANMINQMGAIVVATNPAYVSGFGVAGSNALVLLFMELHFYGYLVAQMSWLWLFALGMLAYRSDLFPRWLGILLMVGTVAYVIHSVAEFFAFSFAPGLSSAMVVLEIVSEVALLLYLLIKGVKTPSVAKPPAARSTT